jgi:hypothetical protein
MELPVEHDPGREALGALCQEVGQRSSRGPGETRSLVLGRQAVVRTRRVETSLAAPADHVDIA